MSDQQQLHDPAERERDAGRADETSHGPGLSQFMPGRFVPPHPPRGSGPVPVWRGFVGERARTAVYGWSERAFTLPYFQRRVFGHNVHIPLDPDAAQRVLLDNAANYVKPGLVKKLLKPTIGRGLLSSDGTLWRDQRKIVAANFAPAAIDALVPVFAGAARQASEAWTAGSADMAAQATETTMRIISNSLFAGDPRLTTQAAMDHITAALDGVSEARLQVLLGLPLMPWSLRGKRARRGQIYLRETLTAVVRDRLPGGGPDDFLGRLIRALNARFEPHEALALAVDNAATFYLAGHETTANAITWTLYLLSELPALQDRLAQEAQAALSVGEEDADLPERLPLLRQVVEESMRIYPPVPRFDREAAVGDELCGQPIAAGDIISIWPWLIHRHHALWDDPDAFDPDRFGPDTKGRRHRFQYLPFGGGPRLCVGQRFAMSEALAVLAHWLSRWTFAPTPGREVRPSGMVTLRPAGGLPLRIAPRP
jgi:cytochrome P450